MTLADAITRARTGEMDGFLFLFHQTAPSVWLAASVLGCPHIGMAMTQIYDTARDSVSSLHSPSDLRVWIGSIAYGVLLRQPDREGCLLPELQRDAAEAYHVISTLPREERTALLLLCAEGCSAPQAAEILSCPDIEIKRAMRRARQTIAAHMKQNGCTATCNTAWLISICSQLCAQSQTQESMFGQILDCVQSGVPFEEPQEIQPAVPSESQEKGFFQKLFRSRRFG